MGHGRLDSILGSNPVPGIDFPPPKTQPKLLARVMWRKIRNWEGTTYGIESAMFYKMFIVEAEIAFHPWQTAASLFAYWKCVGQGVSIPTHNIWQRQFSYEIFKSFTWNRCLQKSIPQQNWLLTRNRFRGLMPGVLKSLKIRLWSWAWQTFGLGNIRGNTDNLLTLTFAYCSICYLFSGPKQSLH
jgi:hypothetical protein